MKHLLFLTALFGLLGSPAWAVTIDADSFGEKDGTGTTLTIAHTVTAVGGNRALFLFCSFRTGTATLTATYADVAMSEVRNDIDAATIRAYIFQLVNPATGTNNWVVTQSTNLAMSCNAVSATNVNQAAPITDHDAEVTGTVSSTLTLSTAADELLLDVQALNIEPGDLAQGGEQTDRPNTPFPSAATTLTHGSSSQAGADGGVMSWAWTGGASQVHGAISIAHSLYGRRPIPPLVLGN